MTTTPQNLDALVGDLRLHPGGPFWDMRKQAADAITTLTRDLRATGAAAIGRVARAKPLTFSWFRDESRPNPSCWRCEGDGYFAYVLIPYDPGNDPAAGTGSWNANPNHRGRMGFESREAAMAYCEETIREQAELALKSAMDAIALWGSTRPQAGSAPAAVPRPALARVLSEEDILNIWRLANQRDADDPVFCAALISSTSASAGWHPIGTAPLDGTRFIARDDSGAIFGCSWSVEDAHWAVHCGQPAVYSAEPVQWVPLGAMTPDSDATAAADRFEEGRLKGWNEAARFLESIRPIDYGPGEEVDDDPEVLLRAAIVGVRILADRLAATPAAATVMPSGSEAGRRTGTSPGDATGTVREALTDAVRDVLVERDRQTSAEGWTPHLDDAYRACELAMAASCYAMAAGMSQPDHAMPDGAPPRGWPWSSSWWKPTTPRRNLVKAGALVLAEIERLDRAAAS